VKLIRDRMPARKGKKRQEYLRDADRLYIPQLLLAKLLEELAEYRLAKDHTERVEELGDLLTVLKSMAYHNQIDWEDVEAAEKRKAKKRGRIETYTIMLDSKIDRDPNQ
jgi:predicted house-cleaning noncanonical NTP pyrophosphatase (MazG superfamily)